MVKRIIPGNMSPWECEINDVKYVYPPGTEQMVPDEVAHVIDAWYASQEPKYPEPVQPEGSGAQPDWNAAEGEPGHILNRPFYGEIAEIMPQTTIEGQDGELAIMQSLGLVAGNTYEVIWNGEPYSSVAVDYYIESMKAGVMIGETDLIAGSEPTGKYPFIIVEFVPEAAADTGVPCAAMALDGSSSAVVSISGEVIHPIDTKYLPEMNNNSHNNFVEIDLQVNSNMTITVAKSGMTFSYITSLADEDKPTVAIARINGVPGSPMYFYLNSCSDVAIIFERLYPAGDAIDYERIEAISDGTWSYTKKKYLMTTAPAS